MPITGSQQAYEYALSNVGRSGAIRSNYTSGHACVSIAGVQYGAGRATASEKVLADSLTITETSDVTPSTCQFTVKGFIPTNGQEVIITIGSQNNDDREFAGHILAPTYGYERTAINGEHVVSAIDYSWLLTRTKI